MTVTTDTISLKSQEVLEDRNKTPQRQTPRFRWLLKHCCLGRFTKEICHTWDLNLNLIFLPLPWLQGQPLVIHSSRRSMASLEGGCSTAVSAFEHDQCLTNGNLSRDGNFITSLKEEGGWRNLLQCFIISTVHKNIFQHLILISLLQFKPLIPCLIHHGQREQVIPSFLVVAFHTLDNCYLASLVSLSFRSSAHSTFLHRCLFLELWSFPLLPLDFLPWSTCFLMCSAQDWAQESGQTFLSIYFVTAHHCWLVSSLWSPSPTYPSPKTSQRCVHPWMRHLLVVPAEWHSGLLPMLFLICHYYLDFSASPSAYQLSPPACKFNKCSLSHRQCLY